MRLKTVILRNFRCYREEIRIDIEEGITALIGRNDVGKSTILEALDIFFEAGTVKMEQLDKCVHGECDDVLIGCVFDDLPAELVVDADHPTSLQAEYLVNEDGYLEVHKVFRCGLKTPKASTYVVARHPTAEGVADLLQLKISDLKARMKEQDVSEEGVDTRIKSEIRQALWQNADTLKVETVNVPVEDEDAKRIWQQLSGYLPTFALFRADRPSVDQDSEVQDPMKAAVRQAIRAVETDLEEIAKRVKAEATKTAQATLQKLKDMAPDVANELTPRFDDPKWANLFKLELDADDGIPVNKRGSGVRRLILLSFFRAEAEKEKDEKQAPGIIYAIEEPETSQHPHNQKLLVEALTELAERQDCQVIITTHVPGLAGMLPVDPDSLRFITRVDDGKTALYEGVDKLARIADELGVIPDTRIRVLLFVEGPHDIEFLGHMCNVLREAGHDVADLLADPAVACIPMGGQTLLQWIQHRYLESMDRPQVYVMDGDREAYQEACEQVNRWGGGCRAFTTRKREMENYLHPEAIREVYDFTLTIEDDTDVPVAIARLVHENSGSGTPWEELSEDKRGKKEKRAKQRLNSEVAERMTAERWEETDPDGEILEWLKYVTEKSQE